MLQLDSLDLFPIVPRPAYHPDRQPELGSLGWVDGLESEEEDLELDFPEQPSRLFR